MKIPMNFHSAELLTQSLCLSITDSVCEAGADAAVTLEKIRQASTFAHELARFLDNLSTAIAGKTPICDDETEEHSELRRAVALRANPPSISKVAPIISICGDGPGAA